VKTHKTIGDGGEHYVLGMLSFGGITCFSTPKDWEDYDIIADRRDAGIHKLERISVKTRSKTKSFGKAAWYKISDLTQIDWLACVFTSPFEAVKIRTWLIPSKRLRNDYGNKKTIRIPFGKLETKYANFENNWTLMEKL